MEKCNKTIPIWLNTVMARFIEEDQLPPVLTNQEADLKLRFRVKT